MKILQNKECFCISARYETLEVIREILLSFKYIEDDNISYKLNIKSSQIILYGYGEPNIFRAYSNIAWQGTEISFKEFIKIIK